MANIDDYGPVVIGAGKTLRPGDEGFEEAKAGAVRYDPPPLNLSETTFQGFTWEGRTFLFGEGEVSMERFNEVVGGPIGDTGYTVTFSVSDDDDE